MKWVYIISKTLINIHTRKYNNSYKSYVFHLFLNARILGINLHLSASLNICEHLREIIYHLLCGVKELVDIIVLNQKLSSKNTILIGLLIIEVSKHLT